MHAIMVVDLIKAQFAATGSPATVPLLNHSTFNACLVHDGVEVDNLANQPFLPWIVFEETVDLLSRNGGRAKRGNAMTAHLGEQGLELITVEGYVAHKVYGRQRGQFVFRRIAPIGGLLIWAGICEPAPGELVLKR
jgi:hypothetical protein